MVKNPFVNARDVRDTDLIPGLGDPLEKEMEAHSSVLAGEIPWEIPSQRSLVGYNPWISELDTTAHLSTSMITATLFTIAKTWKQPKCSLTEEWIKKMYIYTMEYYSAIKKNEIGSFVEMWMDLESVIHSKVSQKEKNNDHILAHICGI